MAMGNELYGKLRGHLGPRKLRPDRAAAEPSHARGRLPGRAGPEFLGARSKTKI